MVGQVGPLRVTDGSIKLVSHSTPSFWYRKSKHINKQNTGVCPVFGLWSEKTFENDCLATSCLRSFCPMFKQLSSLFIYVFSPLHFVAKS